jgi:endonuclease/exonuclease/phosphatase family metal-dependent hydrolase
MVPTRGILTVALGLMCLGVAAVGWSAPAPGSADEDALRVMTFNIRYDNPADGEDAWPNRRAKAASMIRFHGADVVGLQEALRNQIVDLETALPQFGWFGTGRSAERDGEHCAVFFRRERLEVLAESTIWLSETPEFAGSRGWDAALPRVVTWGKLRDRRTGAVFHLFNTHFDHRGEGARRESARLLLRKVAEIAGPEGPVVVSGDLNTTPESEPYRILTMGDGRRGTLVDALHASSCPHHGPTSSWNAFKAIEPGRRIDFILVRPPVGVRQHGILSDTFDGRFPSDHLPVIAEIRIGDSRGEPLCGVGASATRGEGGEAGVSLDVKDAPVVDIVRALAEAGGFQVVFDPGVTCRLTMKVNEARWRSVLETALSACSLGHEEEGNILRVAPVSQLREEAAARRRLEEERRAASSGRLSSFRLSYARAQEVAPLLQRLLAPVGRVTYDSRTNTLVVVY